MAEAAVARLEQERLPRSSTSCSGAAAGGSRGRCAGSERASQRDHRRFRARQGTSHRHL